MTIFAEKKSIVSPGELLAEGEYNAGENVYRDGKRVYSQKLGMVDVEQKTLRVVALRGKYMPRPGDLVVGQVVDVSMGGWIVDINSPYNAMLSVGDVTGRPFGPKLESLTNILGIGETVVAEVVAFDRTRDPSITIQNPGLGRVDGGLVVDLTPTKVPRLIGRKGSMISLIKQGTGCDIVVGQNGKVLVRGRSPNMVELVVKAVKMVEEESHTSGLTDRIAELIESEQKAKTDAKTTKTD